MRREIDRKQQIIDAFREGEWLFSHDLKTRVAIPHGTLHAYLTKLIQEGFLVREKLSDRGSICYLYGVSKDKTYKPPKTQIASSPPSELISLVLSGGWLTSAKAPSIL